MKERPIIFSGPMVRAILEGRKSQTRRVCKPEHFHGSELPPDSALRRAMEFGSRSPYGDPGDRLWVRETTIRVEEHGYVGPIYVASDDGAAILNWGLGPGDDYADVDPHNLKLRPAIHMPRSMSRLTLEIKAVRVERLQEISEEDARAEGFGVAFGPGMFARAFDSYWDSINAKRGYGWHANPWVWVIEFERVD